MWTRLKEIRTKEVVAEPGSGSNSTFYQAKKNLLIAMDELGVWLVNKTTGDYRWTPIGNVTYTTHETMPQEVKDLMRDERGRGAEAGEGKIPTPAGARQASGAAR